MIINCPKCGFEQPKIEYCAKCGVNIDTYKKKAPALSDRITKNSITYVIFILSILIGSGFFIKENWFSTSKKQAGFQPAEAVISQEINREPASEKTKPKEKVKKEAPALAVKKVAETKEMPHIQVRVYEIPTNYLSFFAKEILSLEELSRLQGFYIDKADSKYLKRLLQISPLYETSYYVNAFQKPLIIKQSVFDEESREELGFYTSVSIDSYKDDELLVSLIINTKFYQSAESEEIRQQKMNDTISFQKGDSFLVFGIFPHRKRHEAEKIFMDRGYMALMNSEAFLANETSFALLFSY